MFGYVGVSVWFWGTFFVRSPSEVFRRRRLILAYILRQHVVKIRTPVALYLRLCRCVSIQLAVADTQNKTLLSAKFADVSKQGAHTLVGAI